MRAPIYIMDKVRIGIIGMGNMGRFHANDLLDGKVARGELAAVGSTSPHKLDEYKDCLLYTSDAADE